MTAQAKGFYFSRAQVARRKAEQKRRSLSQAPRPSHLHLVSKNDIKGGEEINTGEVHAAFSACRDSLADLEKTNLSGDEKLSDILSNVLRFYLAGTANSTSQAAYNNLIKETNIKVTKNTRNPLLPAFKAIFGDTNKSSLGRYAAALKFACDKNIEPDKLPDFLKNGGGLVACARQGAALLNPHRATEKEKREKKAIAALHKAEKLIKASGLLKELPYGFSETLLFKDADGNLKLLSHRAVESSAASRFKPLV